MNSTEHSGKSLKTPPSSDGKQLIPLLDSGRSAPNPDTGMNSNKEASRLSIASGAR